MIPCRTNINKIFYKVLFIGSRKSDIPAYLMTYVFVCHSTVYAGPSIGKKIKTYRHTPHLYDVIVVGHHYQYALILQDIVRIMKVLLPDQLAYHAYIIQAAALAPAEHFYSQNGGKRAATRQGKSERWRVEEVQRGRLGGVCHQGYVKISLSTMS